MRRCDTFESSAKSLESIARGYVWIVWWIDSHAVRPSARVEMDARTLRERSRVRMMLRILDGWIWDNAS